MRRSTTPVSWNEGRAIHIGTNRVDDRVYQGWLPELMSAENDARAMRDFAASMGCSSRPLLGEDATRESVVAALDSTIERLVPGDFLLVSYSGHMTSLAGFGDDPDGWDEAWCLFDGILLDDEFHDLLSAIPPQCGVLVVTDSCFAGGAVDGETAFDLNALSRSVARSLPEGGPTHLSVLQRAGALPEGVPGPGAGPPLPAEAGLPVHPAVVHPPPTHPPRVHRPQVHHRPGPGRPPPRPDLTSTLRKMRLRPDEVLLQQRAPSTRLGDFAIAELVRRGAIPRGESLPASRRRPISASVIAIAATAEGSLAFEGSEHGLLTAALLEVEDWLGDRSVGYEELMEILAELLPLQRPTLGVFGAARRDELAAGALRADSADPVTLTPAPSRQRRHRRR